MKWFNGHSIESIDSDICTLADILEPELGCGDVSPTECFSVMLQAHPPVSPEFTALDEAVCFYIMSDQLQLPNSAQPQEFF